MDENQNAVQDFFNQLPTEDKRGADIFGAEEVTPAPVEQTDEDEQEPEKDAAQKANRQERRRDKQLQWEREQRIALEARLKAVEEARTTVRDDSVDERLVRLYGAEQIDAAKLHQQLLDDTLTKAEEAAYRRLMAEQEAKVAEQAQFESFIDEQFEAIEDEHDVDLTSNAPAARKARREFLELVQRLSPKDKQGNITDYADFLETWQLYQARAQKPAEKERAKEIAARSMQRTSPGQPAAKEPTPGFRGWMRDFNLNG